MTANSAMKRWHLEQLLERGMVMVHLDASRPGVCVPPQHAGEAHLRLNLSYRFRPCDLELDDDRIAVTLTFGGSPWACRLPYEAVFGLTSHVTGESLMWFEDVPEEVLYSLVAPEGAPGESMVMLRAIEGEAAPRACGPAVAAPERRAHLRVVK